MSERCGVRLPIGHADLVCGRKAGHPGQHECTRADGSKTGWTDPVPVAPPAPEVNVSFRPFEDHPVTDLSAAPAADFEAARARWEAAEEAEEATVERMALALYKAAGDGAPPWREPWERVVERRREIYRRLARAAIDAITTPVRQEAGR